MRLGGSGRVVLLAPLALYTLLLLLQPPPAAAQASATARKGSSAAKVDLLQTGGGDGFAVGGGVGVVLRYPHISGLSAQSSCEVPATGGLAVFAEVACVWAPSAAAAATVGADVEPVLELGAAAAAREDAEVARVDRFWPANFVANHRSSFATKTDDLPRPLRGWAFAHHLNDTKLYRPATVNFDPTYNQKDGDLAALVARGITCLGWGYCWDSPSKHAVNASYFAENGRVNSTEFPRMSGRGLDECNKGNNRSVDEKAVAAAGFRLAKQQQPDTVIAAWGANAGDEVFASLMADRTFDYAMIEGYTYCPGCGTWPATGACCSNAGVADWRAAGKGRLDYARAQGYSNRTLFCFGFLLGRSPINPGGWTRGILRASLVQLRAAYPELAGVLMYGHDPRKGFANASAGATPATDRATLDLIVYANELMLELYPDPRPRGPSRSPRLKTDEPRWSLLPHKIVNEMALADRTKHTLGDPRPPPSASASLHADGHRGLKTDDSSSLLPHSRDDSATTNSTNKIAHFSWYAGPSQRPGKAYTNLAQHGNLTFLQRSYEELGVPGMLRLDQSKWSSDWISSECPWIQVTHPVFNNSVPPMALTTTWEAAVDDCIATLTPLAKNNGGHIHGVQLGDELVCGSGFPLSNLSALSARLHDGLHKHGVFIMTNECFVSNLRRCCLYLRAHPCLSLRRLPVVLCPLWRLNLPLR
jgi:hypothetical protein